MEFNDKIKDHMKTDITYAEVEERLANVIFKMSKAEADIAVVKSKEDIVGVITASDIYSALVKEVFAEDVKGAGSSAEIEDMKVIEIMKGPPVKKFMSACQLGGSNPCIQAHEDTTIKDAIRIMERSGLHHLLVMDDKSNLVGTISSTDIIRSFGRGKFKKE
jgi:CBS domain-containing protein